MPIAIALYQPDIPGNTGTIIRLAACIGFAVHIIEPAGFDISDRNLRRAGMDYLQLAQVERHSDWTSFKDYVHRQQRRLVLFSTKSQRTYFDATYQDNDILLFGRETAGVPDFVAEEAALMVKIPMKSTTRSLNLAVSVAMASGEVLSQQHHALNCE